MIPHLDTDEREALAQHYRARIVELRDDLELITLDFEKTQAKRGAIAELRALLGQLYPQNSATRDPRGSGTIY